MTSAYCPSPVPLTTTRLSATTVTPLLVTGLAALDADHLPSAGPWKTEFPAAFFTVGKVTVCAALLFGVPTKLGLVRRVEGESFAVIGQVVLEGVVGDVQIVGVVLDAHGAARAPRPGPGPAVLPAMAESRIQ